MNDPREAVSKIAATIPISQELLDDVPEVDFWNAVQQAPSPLEAARETVNEAEDALDAAEEALDVAQAELAVVEATPGSDLRPPPFTVNGALRDAVARMGEG